MKISYDPSKKYTWSVEDEFVFTGEQYGVILNAIRASLGTPEAQKVIALLKANDMVEMTLAKAVEEGTVKEVVEENINNLKVVK